MRRQVSCSRGERRSPGHWLSLFFHLLKMLLQVPRSSDALLSLQERTVGDAECILFFVGRCFRLVILFLCFCSYVDRFFLATIPENPARLVCSNRRNQTAIFQKFASHSQSFYRRLLQTEYEIAVSFSTEWPFFFALDTEHSGKTEWSRRTPSGFFFASISPERAESIRDTPRNVNRERVSFEGRGR